MSVCISVSPMPGSHTSVALGASINTAVQSVWAGEGSVIPFRRRVWSITADGAKAQQNAFDHLSPGFFAWTMWCVDHLLNLVIKASLAGVPSVLGTMTKMRRLAVSVRRSPLQQEKLTQINSALQINANKVILDVVTRCLLYFFVCRTCFACSAYRPATVVFVYCTCISTCT